MSLVSSFFLVLALVFTVTMGPQTRPWSWGPAILALGASTLFAFPCLLKREQSRNDLFLVAYCVIVAVWFAFRAWTSPVADLADSDLLLLTAAIGFFISTRVIMSDPKAEKVFFWGLALLLLANLVVMGIQHTNPFFYPIFNNESGSRPLLQGFFGHYNENANFLNASSMIVGAAALFGHHHATSRFFLGLLGIVGVVSIWFTRSRGGILAAAIAVAVFATIALIIAKRQNKRWFAPGVIAFPIVGILSIMFLLGGWESAQKQRSQDSGIEELMDNDIRLYMMGMALEAIQSDAAIGGGSRSFSWDSYQLWDEKSYGVGGAKPEMVHNELLQAATDYGLIGAFLILGLLGGALFTVFIKTTFEQGSALADSRHFWRLGGIAAMAGMFVQSNFSFVFHLLPGVSLLGICFASCYWMPLKPRSATSLVTGILLIGSCVFCLFTSLPLAWKGTLALRALWTSHYGKTGSKSLHSKVSSLDEAIHLWPRYEFYLERAMLHQQLAGAPDNSEFEDYAKFAMSDYQKAFQRHPFSPEISINQANLLSSMGLSDEADVAYRKAISLQGQMEPAFRAHYYKAEHLLRRSLQLYREGDAANALLAIEDSAEHIETANRLTPAWVINIKGRNLRISIHERLGTMREANGNRDGAIAAYNFAASIPGGNRAHYRSAVLIGRIGRDAWAKRRPSEALYRFIEARRHLGLAARELPEGVTLTSSLELSEYLDKAINLLKAAKVEPQE